MTDLPLLVRWSQLSRGVVSIGLGSTADAAEGSGEEGGVSSTWPTIKDSEERKKSRWKCFEATLRAMYTSRHQNLDQVFLKDATIILVVNM